MNITIEARKEWWRLCYGVTSMKEALRGCDMLLSVCETNRHQAFLPLAYYIHTQYGRPFHHNHGVGRVDRKIVPEATIHHHRWLMEFRDSVFSHSDSEHSKESGKILNDLVFTVTSDDLIFSTSDPRPEISFYVEARKHIEIMLCVFAEAVFEIKKKYEDVLPKVSGDYLLSLDKVDQLFLPYTRPDKGILNYRRDT